MSESDPHPLAYIHTNHHFQPNQISGQYNQRDSAVSRSAVLICGSRLARRGGVKRISALCYEETRAALKQRLEAVRPELRTDEETTLTRQILSRCVMYVEHANRKTVTASDVRVAFCGVVRILGQDADILARSSMLSGVWAIRSMALIPTHSKTRGPKPARRFTTPSNVTEGYGE